MSVRNAPPPPLLAEQRLPDSLTWESRLLRLRPYPLTSDTLINVVFTVERGGLRFQVGFFPVRHQFRQLTAEEIRTGKGEQVFPVIAVAEIYQAGKGTPLVSTTAAGETYEETAREAMLAADQAARVLSLKVTPEGPWRAQ